VAADDPSIAAVVAQLPFMGVDLRGSSPRTGRVTRTLFRAAIRDAIGGVFGRAPVTIPMVGEPGAVAVFTGTEDNTVARALAAEAPEWRNEMAARSLFSLIGYRPGKLAGRLVMPLLICVADDDTAGRCHWLSALPSRHRAASCAAIRAVTSPPTSVRCSSRWSVTRSSSCDGTWPQHRPRPPGPGDRRRRSARGRRLTYRRCGVPTPGWGRLVPCVNK
jgi:hypothetical protein